MTLLHVISMLSCRHQVFTNYNINDSSMNPNDCSGYKYMIFSRCRNSLPQSIESIWFRVCTRPSGPILRPLLERFVIWGRIFRPNLMLDLHHFCISRKNYLRTDQPADGHIPIFRCKAACKYYWLIYYLRHKKRSNCVHTYITS